MKAPRPTILEVKGLGWPWKTDYCCRLQTRLVCQKWQVGSSMLRKGRFAAVEAGSKGGRTFALLQRVEATLTLILGAWPFLQRPCLLSLLLRSQSRSSVAEKVHLFGANFHLMMDRTLRTSQNYDLSLSDFAIIKGLAEEVAKAEGLTRSGGLLAFETSLMHVFNLFIHFSWCLMNELWYFLPVFFWETKSKMLPETKQTKYIDYLVSIENLVRVHSNHIRNYKHHINKNSWEIRSILSYSFK